MKIVPTFQFSHEEAPRGGAGIEILMPPATGQCKPKPLVEGLVLKFSDVVSQYDVGEAPRGGAGIEIVMQTRQARTQVEAPRGGAGIEMDI